MLLIDSLLSLIAPHTCLGCEAEGALVCQWCLPDFAEPVPSRCYRCLAQTGDFAVCNRCKPQTRLRHVWVRTAYQGNAKELIRRLKFERAQAAANIVAELTSEALPYISPNTILVPVPTASSRVRQRGYDQTVLLARHLSNQLGLPMMLALSRRGQARQVGMTRVQRQQQLQTAFKVKARVSLRGSEILLVDDVVTTGATLEAAASALKRAGGKHVNAVAFAHTPPL